MRPGSEGQERGPNKPPADPWNVNTGGKKNKTNKQVSKGRKETEGVKGMQGGCKYNKGKLAFKREKRGQGSLNKKKPWKPGAKSERKSFWTRQNGSKERPLYLGTTILQVVSSGSQEKRRAAKELQTLQDLKEKRSPTHSKHKGHWKKRNNKIARPPFKGKRLKQKKVF